MVQVWQNYQTDLGRAYPFFALSTRQINEVNTSINPIDLLPTAILSNLLDVRYPCAVSGLTPRYLLLFANDGAQFTVTYPTPFDDSLAQFLTNSLELVAWEFVGERLRYGRLRKLLDNV